MGMTREEAIKVLKNTEDNINYDKRREEIYFTHEWVGAYEMAISALRAQPQWISVEERLPEREEDVLMLFETGIITGGFICDSDTWCAYSDGEYYTDCSNHPTHWMPLPSAPKEEL